jgi:uncharacterized protein DUF2568
MQNQGTYVLVAAAAFLSELALLAILGVAGWHFGGGGLLSLALAVLAPALAVLLWSVWVAPTAAHRLGDPPRLILQIALFVVAAALAGIAGHTVWGVVVAGAGVIAFSSSRLVDGGRDSAGRPTT